MLVIDPSENNSFDANEHIGLEFIRKDQCKLAARAKVIEVEEDTGKVLLEYVHSGLELVDTNIIQEALLFKEQHGDAEGLWTFSKVLKCRTFKNGKIKVEVLWNNGGLPGNHWE
eukprot:7464460-Ditylum_brightwellii.AAC.1